MYACHTGCLRCAAVIAVGCKLIMPNSQHATAAPGNLLPYCRGFTVWNKVNRICKLAAELPTDRSTGLKTTPRQHSGVNSQPSLSKRSETAKIRIYITSKLYLSCQTLKSKRQSQGVIGSAELCRNGPVHRVTLWMVLRWMVLRWMVLRWMSCYFWWDVLIPPSVCHQMVASSAAMGCRGLNRARLPADSGLTCVLLASHPYLWMWCAEKRSVVLRSGIH